MSRFSVEGLPRPVVVQELDVEAAFRRRLDEFVDLMEEAGRSYDVQDLETDPAAIAAQAAGNADTFFTAMLNDTARVILLDEFAEGTDLDLRLKRVGLERLEGESDAVARERSRLAQKGKSAAGPDDYYKSAARNHSVLVRDVEVRAETRDFSSRVLILSVLTTDNGGLISEELAASLTVALNDTSFRSRNVSVEIEAAVITTRNVVGTLYIYPETPDTVVDQAEAALIAAAAADQRLGFDLTRSYIHRHLHRAGVQRVELTGWVDANSAVNEAVRLGTVTLTSVRLAT